MLTEEQAKKIGIRACVDKLGYDFCMRHQDNAVSAYGKEDAGKIECFVGVSDELYVELETPCLTSYYRWPYAARCLVDLHTGKVEFIEIRQKHSIETEKRSIDEVAKELDAKYGIVRETVPETGIISHILMLNFV